MSSRVTATVKPEANRFVIVKVQRWCDVSEWTPLSRVETIGVLIWLKPVSPPKR
ncbi:MAG: hypothetical protein L0191_21625 [Acidobacteria bacterium]|nr:hypothetical protein [Acidobacteriota bacterium]